MSIWDKYKTTVRTNIDLPPSEIATERQWQLKGYVAINDKCGKMLWTNRNCKQSLRYLHISEVRTMTEDDKKAIAEIENKKKQQAKQKLKSKKAKEQIPQKIKSLCRSIIDLQYQAINASTADIIVLDTETTGINIQTDELLQVSIIDGDGNTLYNSYLHPLRKQQWQSAERVHGISPDMAANSPTILNEVAKMYKIITSAKIIVGYNIEFDLGFLSAVGIDVPDNAEIIDVMRVFSEIYGEWNDYFGDYKYQKLTTCADYYNYDWNNDTAHDSLSDCRATLYCYNQIKAWSRRVDNDKP
ncbi:MAG: exonuclease domain-containing protein [Acutalibacteraceae bacterium]